MSKEVVLMESVKKFRDAFMKGIDGIVNAAEIYVEAIDDDSRNADKFREEFADWIPASAWSQFEAVGRKWLHPKMIMGGIADRKKNAILKRLPYSTQERIFNHERFQLLTHSGDTLMVDILEATPEQVDQLCNADVIRNIAEQKAWCETQHSETTEDAIELLPYTISGGTVHFRRGVKLNKTEVRRILQEM